MVFGRGGGGVGEAVHKGAYVGRVVDVLQVSEDHHGGKMLGSREAYALWMYIDAC